MWVCSKFHALSSRAKKFDNRLRLDKVTDSLMVGTFLRLSVVYRIVSYLSELHICSLSAYYIVLVLQRVKTKAVRGMQLVYRNLPLSIVISVSSITVLYVLVNFTYFVVLGIDGVLQSEAVAVVRLVTSLSILNIIN